MRYTTIIRDQEVGLGWTCASPRCKNPATHHVKRSNAGCIPAAISLYCDRHAPQIHRNLVEQLFPPGQRVIEYYGGDPFLGLRNVQPSDYGTVTSIGPATITVAHDGYEATPNVHPLPANTGLWAVYDN